MAVCGLTRPLARFMGFLAASPVATGGVSITTYKAKQRPAISPRIGERRSSPCGRQLVSHSESHQTVAESDSRVAARFWSFRFGSTSTISGRDWLSMPAKNRTVLLTRIPSA